MNGDIALLGPHALHGLVGARSTAQLPGVVRGVVSVGSFSIAAQSNVVDGMFLKPDGTVVYVHDSSSDAVYQYSISTAWDITSASYAGSASTPASSQGLFFRSDGTRMYTASSGAAAQQYSLSSAWDVTTAAFFSAESLTVTGDVRGIALSASGDRMFVVDAATASSLVRQYSLGTPWDVTTSVAAGTFTLTGGAASGSPNFPRDIKFSSDGLRMFISANVSGLVQFSLSTAWDVTSAVYDGARSFPGSGAGDVAIAFTADESRVYAARTGNDAIYQYDLV